MKNNSIYKKGFTLIELLVVISIIGLLSSVVLSSLNSAKVKTRDTQRKMEFNSLVTAMHLYYDKYGYYPPNMASPVFPYATNFNNMAGTLVTEGFLSKVPVSPCGATCAYTLGGYAYYNYGTGNLALLLTTLETGANSTTGVPPSCRRDWGVGTNWCDDSVSSRQYCMCF